MKAVSPELRAAILGQCRYMVYLCEIDHPSGVVRLNSGVKPVKWGGYTFKALSKMGSVSGIAQSMDTKSQEVTLNMAAPMMDDTAQDIVSMPVRGHLSFVWQAFLRADWSVIPDPIQLANITLDSLQVAIDEGGLHVLMLTGLMTQFAARRVVPVYWSDANQQARFPGDTGMNRMAELADKIV